ncbi:MAG: hypothetical protein B7Z37_26570 [Verrucomicrobia bacterium 12-59-8]|nr:MAG: hypothetical protein B7Z37_26570 [Verrucomicrobia bacterium 12-59-8]
MLDVLVFKPDKVQQSCGNNAVAILDPATEVVMVVVRNAGPLVEVLTPDHADFESVVRLLSVAANVQLKLPTSVKAGGSS